MTDYLDWSIPQDAGSWDLASGMDMTVYSVVSDAKFVCTIPQALGAVTGLSIRSGKVVAETASGIPMIVSTG